jgi:hypothetical protein
MVNKVFTTSSSRKRPTKQLVEPKTSETAQMTKKQISKLMTIANKIEDLKKQFEKQELLWYMQPSTACSMCGPVAARREWSAADCKQGITARSPFVVLGDIDPGP